MDAGRHRRAKGAAMIPDWMVLVIVVILLVYANPRPSRGME